MEIGDKVVWNGSVNGTITGVTIPKCKCKGQGKYTVILDNSNSIIEVKVDDKNLVKFEDKNLNLINDYSLSKFKL